MPVRDGHLRRRGCVRAHRRRRRCRVLTSFWVALSFLTICPAPGHRELAQGDISNSRAHYPLVGLLLGGLIAGAEWCAAQLFPPVLTAAVLIVFLVIVTRALHLDGFMDVCDGLFGGYTPERRLEIMRDSNVGAFAVAGAASLLLLKYAALVSLLAFPPQVKIPALVLFPVVSRWTMVVMLGAFPYARGSGLGSPFHQGGGGVATVAAGIAAVAVSILAGGIGGVCVFAGTSALCLVLGKVVVRLLGGLTGDVYGATNELTEALTLVSAAAMAPYALMQPVHRWAWL